MKKRRLNQRTSAPIATVFVVAASAAITVAAFAELSVTTIMEVIATELGGFHYYPMAFGMAACGQLIATALAGVWCDARSPKYSLMVGGLAFGIGVLASAIAPNMWVFIAGRFATGLGAGFLMVPVYVLVGSLVAKHDQPRAFAMFAAAWVIPSLIGPGIAGWLVEHISWRWIFGFTLILSAPITLAIVYLLRFIEDRYSHPSWRARRTATAATVAGISIVIIQFATIEARWWTYLLGGACALAVVISITYLFPVGTLRLKRGLPSVIASRGLVNAAYMATLTNLPIILVHGREWSPKAAGIAVTIGSVAYAIGSYVQSRITDTHKRHQLPLFGALLISGGVALSGMISFTWWPAWIGILGWGVAGFGVGVSYAALAVRGLSEVTRDRHGEVSSDLQLSDAMGAAIAFGVITGLFSALRDAPGAWPYLPGPLIALTFGLLAILAGRRLARS